MSYCARSDIEIWFGSSNVYLWADINSAKDAVAVAARIAWAIDEATSTIDDMLRGGRYTIPFATVPARIKSVCARLAGCILYESRGIEDSDAGEDSRNRLMIHKVECQKILQAIALGQMRLEVPMKDSQIPANIDTELKDYTQTAQATDSPVWPQQTW